ncbi:hypothetical protein FB554_3181 [Barrientosiimonas humi]|uniref:DUF3592 domain-containing protein n=1 Tax=Barrientosiimonas humi TaxID=999931 RepID=A0A542WZ68_9MICO|nr:DUF3592 domain-containing protein [Barrientosiimonas humi]TQL28873.1 hypothetical protein FB554_3181 [Barrientosiimonas humi]CAG7571207.1 hypothetical protein BH39T_PBIAJDOK_00249 [Barrientosiimonas humi]
MDSGTTLANQALVVLGPALAIFGLWLIVPVVLHSVRSRTWAPTPATVTEIGASRVMRMPWGATGDLSSVWVDDVGDVRWKIRYAFQDRSGRSREGVARWHSDLPPAVGDAITVLVSPRLSRSMFVDFNPVVRAVGGLVAVAVGLLLLVDAVNGLRG